MGNWGTSKEDKATLPFEASVQSHCNALIQTLKVASAHALYIHGMDHLTEQSFPTESLVDQFNSKSECLELVYCDGLGLRNALMWKSELCAVFKHSTIR